ncbi:MAG: hypothetical protein IAF02_10775 [Anaerolineae bacterium]|nr:hypothetical protein [Anaerolineae bacterium]
MFKIIFGVFIVLHGLVHLLYFGQSRRMFELQPGMVWPDGSWAFSWLLSDGMTRWLTSTLLILAAIGFTVGGVGLLLKHSWWSSVVVGSAVFSCSIYILCWDGRWQDMDDKGLVGVLINLGIVTAVLFFQWPKI